MRNEKWEMKMRPWEISFLTPIGAKLKKWLVDPEISRKKGSLGSLG